MLVGDVHDLIEALGAKPIKRGETERPPSVSFLKAVYACIRRLYTFGRLYGLTSNDPCFVNMSWQKLGSKRSVYDKKRGRPKVLTLEQRKALLDAS